MPESTLSPSAVGCALDRRDAPRFDCELRASVEEAPNGGPLAAVRVGNVSASGVGLLSDRPLDQGLSLIVVLRDRDGVVSAALAAEVVYCVPDVADSWMLGCTFARPLRDDELTSLIF